MNLNYNKFVLKRERERDTQQIHLYLLKKIKNKELFKSLYPHHHHLELSQIVIKEVNMRIYTEKETYKQLN